MISFFGLTYFLIAVLTWSTVRLSILSSRSLVVWMSRLLASRDPQMLNRPSSLERETRLPCRIDCLARASSSSVTPSLSSSFNYSSMALTTVGEFSGFEIA